MTHLNSNNQIPNDSLVYIQSYNLKDIHSSEQQTEFMKILFPEIDTSSQESGNLLNSIGESQLNYFINRELLRPIEKEVAKKVGLEDLQINYNFGQEFIANKMNDDNMIGVNIAKNITSKLLLQIKSNIDIDSSRQQTTFSDYLSEIELNYYILNNLSINYSAGKDHIYEEQFKSKLSLRFLHEF